jgi:hypothetical protein
MAMKYKERDALVEGLRELADFIEAKGLELPHIDARAVSWVYGYSPKTYQDDPERAKRDMRKAAKTLGKAEKNHTGNWFELKRRFGPVLLEINTNRQNICERKVVGTREIEEKVIPARTEEIVEWECYDLLSVEIKPEYVHGVEGVVFAVFPPVQGSEAIQLEFTAEAAENLGYYLIDAANESREKAQEEAA